MADGADGLGRPTLGQLTHFRIVLKPGTDPYGEGRFAEVAKRVYQILDERLRTLAWIAGDAYSIADMAVYPWIFYLESMALQPTNIPHWSIGAIRSPRGRPRALP